MKKYVIVRAIVVFMMTVPLLCIGRRGQETGLSKRLRCFVADTITLDNPVIVYDQSLAYLFDSIPSDFSRKKLKSMLKNDRWYVFPYGNAPYFELADLDWDIYNKWRRFLAQSEEDVIYLEKEKMWIGRYRARKQLFLMLLVEMDAVNEIFFYDIDRFPEYIYEKAPRQYPQVNSQTYYVRVMFPINYADDLPI